MLVVPGCRAMMMIIIMTTVNITMSNIMIFIATLLPIIVKASLLEILVLALVSRARLFGTSQVWRLLPAPLSGSWRWLSCAWERIAAFDSSGEGSRGLIRACKAFGVQGYLGLRGLRLMRV